MLFLCKCLGFSPPAHPTPRPDHQLGNYNLALGTTEPLGAPVNFAVTTASSQFLHLSWAAPLNAGNEKLTYIIYTRPNGSTAPFEETETELTTSYVMGGLTGGMSWELQISAGERPKKKRGLPPRSTGV